MILVSELLREICALPTLMDSIHNEKRLFCEILKTRRLQVNGIIGNTKEPNKLLLSYLIGCTSRIMYDICEKYKTKGEIMMEQSIPKPNQQNQTSKTIIKCANCFDT